jgi:predicted outer membrane repeat protein
MLAVSPACLLRRTVPVIPVLLSLYGCSDAAAPVAPRIDTRPHALAASVLTVTNTGDSGPGSLRQTILDAAPGTTIQFDGSIAGQTIVLSTGQLEIDKALTIEGPVPAGMTLSGGLSSRLFLVQDAGDLTLRNVSIVDGEADPGGGIFNLGRLMLDHSLVANNEADSLGGGGGIASSGELTLVNTTVSGNVASSLGGGIRAAGSVTIRNSTIAGNAGGSGGGIEAPAGTISLRNSIIADNTDLGGSPSNCLFGTGVATSFLGRNLSSDDTCGDAAALLVGEARLKSLAGNGGPTKTHALADDSPAIDRGTLCNEATDQRYVPRPQGASCDLGAFEFNDYGTYTITVGPNVAVNAKTGVITLTGTISCSKPTTQLGLNVNVSQTQKTTGRFATIVQADGFVGFSFCGPSPSSWSVPLTPQSGKFEPGSATGTASTGVHAANFTPATVTSALKVFQVK